ncbi:putative coil containing protein [Vibrio phage 242E40-1]|nr:putative coil containing protein [Vibrio phage 242E40-1]
MITCKEDLIGTFIRNDNGELRDLYISLCESLLIAGTPKDLMMSNDNWLGLNRECKFIGVYEGGMWIAHQYRSNEKQLNLEDLKPQTKGIEWVNGDKCIYNDEEFTFVSYMCKPEEDHVVIWRSFDGIEVVYKTQISKPETPEQKLEREELELVCIAMSDIDAETGDRSCVDGVVLRLIKAGYRKGC